MALDRLQDQVHLSYCVTALAVAHLMRRQARQARQGGLDLSVRELLAQLAGIQETVLLYPPPAAGPRARRILTEMAPTQKQVYEISSPQPVRTHPMTNLGNTPSHHQNRP